MRFNDGSEELCDHKTDPNEWHNLATKLASSEVKTRLARSLPKTNAPSLPGMKGGSPWLKKEYKQEMDMASPNEKTRKKTKVDKTSPSP